MKTTKKDLDYEREYIRLWNAAEQLLDNVDIENRIVASWAAMSVLKNAVDYGREAQPGNSADSNACRFCGRKDIHAASCPHGPTII